MQKLLSALLLCSVLLACSKSKDDDRGPDEGPAYFTVKNETSTALQNLVAGYIQSGNGKLIKNFGTLEKDATTGETRVDDQVTGVYFFFDLASKTYMLINERPVTRGMIANIVITNGSTSEEIFKTDPRYPK